MLNVPCTEEAIDQLKMFSLGSSSQHQRAEADTIKQWKAAAACRSEADEAALVLLANPGAWHGMRS